MNFKYQIIKHLKPKFLYVLKVKPKPKLILDIGVANNSYIEFKKIYPESIYHGVDYIDQGLKLEKGDSFILENLESTDPLRGLTPIYDVIIVNHVLEHLKNGKEVFLRLCELLTPGGVLYAEFPSIRTAYHRKSFTSYHFHDDATHQIFYLVEVLANLAMSKNCKIISCGPISTPLKNLLSPIRAFFGLLMGKGSGPFLLHFRGQIDHIFVRRPFF